MNFVLHNALHNQQLQQQQQPDAAEEEGGADEPQPVFRGFSRSKIFQAGGLAQTTPSPKKKELGLAPPTSIEGVPFRRQDRRILNARKKRLMDRQLYKCILCSGFLVALLGLLFLLAYLYYRNEFDWTQPFVVIGSVLEVCGLAIMLFSVEVYLRLRKNSKRVRDPELDRLTNLHYVKHWMDPAVVPYGWGHDEEDEDDEVAASKRRQAEIRSETDCVDGSGPVDAPQVAKDETMPRLQEREEFDFIDDSL